MWLTFGMTFSPTPSPRPRLRLDYIDERGNYRNRFFRTEQARQRFIVNHCNIEVLAYCDSADYQR